MANERASQDRMSKETSESDPSIRPSWAHQNENSTNPRGAFVTHLDHTPRAWHLAFARLIESHGVVPDEAGTGSGNGGHDGADGSLRASDRGLAGPASAKVSGTRHAATVPPRSVYRGGASWP